MNNFRGLRTTSRGSGESPSHGPNARWTHLLVLMLGVTLPTAGVAAPRGCGRGGAVCQATNGPTKVSHEAVRLPATSKVAARPAVRPSRPAAGRAKTIAPIYDTRDVARVIRRCTTALEARLPGARVGVVVIDRKTGQRCVQGRAHETFVPASTAKLLVGCATLDCLGPKHTLNTSLLAQGSREGSVLRGDLILAAQGDPSLHQGDIEALVAQVAEKGIRHITGDLVYPTPLPDDQALGAGWAWDDLDSEDAPRASSLALDGNCRRLDIAPALIPGVPVRVWSFPTVSGGGEPSVAGSMPTVEASTVPCSDQAQVETRVPLHDERALVQGNLAQGRGAVCRVPVERPDTVAARFLLRALEQQGVVLEGQLRPDQVSPENLPLQSALAVHASSPLASLVAHTLKVSDNFYAQQLMLSVHAPARRTEGRSAGSRLRGLEALKRWFESCVGIRSSQYRLVDASGLSRYDLIRPMDLAELLVKVVDRPWFPQLLKALPHSGVDGTLRKRLRTPKLRNRVWAKTGSMGGVCNLAGYLLDGGGRPRYVVVCMINGFHLDLDQARAAQDAWLEQLAEVLAANTP